MEILKVLSGVEIISTYGDLNISVEDVFNDSRSVVKDSMFICINGNTVDGHNYINKAIESGANCILIEKEVEYVEGVTYIMVKDTSKAMSTIAKNFFENPCEKIKLIGVTGTNGKSSTISFIKQILDYDCKVGLLGTIEIFDGKETHASQNTTPDSLAINRYLYKMINNGCKYCVMEVSSHALVLDRVENIDYNVGIFTNLTQDHLDFHKTLESYKQAKEKLFYKTTEINLFNLDDAAGDDFYKTNKNEKTKNYTYAIDREADLRAQNIELTSHDIKYDLIVEGKSYEVQIPVVGYFNVYNTLASIATCMLLGVDIEEIVKRVNSLNNVSGRFDYVQNDKGVDVVVDYAHTPDAILNLLKSARLLTKGRLIVIFGCGGNRDKEKRPIMGGIAQENSDIAILTSDNPRFEKQEDIARDILVGMNQAADDFYVIEDRREAIEKAVQIYEEGDLIVIAGKGHEDYQIKDGKKSYFDDRKIAKEIIDAR